MAPRPGTGRIASIAETGDATTRTAEMHVHLTEQLIRDHHATLEREARQHALAKAAAAAGRASRDAGRAGLMPHVQEHGRLRRAIAALLRPSPA
jgi:hypothetical protein